MPPRANRGNRGRRSLHTGRCPDRRSGPRAAWAGLALAACLACAAPPAGAQEAAGACRPGPARSDSIADIAERGEIRFASGSRALLGSVRWPDEPAAEDAARAWLGARIGRPLAVSERGGADRWGRARVDAVADEAEDLAGGLVAAGLAAVDAGEGDALCRPALLQVEARARASGLGLWARPVLSAPDGLALRARAGRFVVAEGRLLHVGVRPARTYLDFVSRGADGLTVTVSKRTWRRMLEHGLSAAGLTRKNVRVRGIVEVRRGPVIEIAAPELIEVLEGGPADAAAGGTDGGRALRR